MWEQITEEVRARLEVAQLYEGMPGQKGKAARYYLSAASMLIEFGLPGTAGALCQKILELEPSNAQATHFLSTGIPTEPEIDIRPENICPQNSRRSAFNIIPIDIRGKPIIRDEPDQAPDTPVPQNPIPPKRGPGAAQAYPTPDSSANE